MRTCCVLVIGHVDHGKTALVRALTGAETDRLPEEKARGLSIVPGFAHCVYPGGIVDLVDAPGHGDFVQAMITGAAGAQAVLVVVSAVDGVQEQTLEHLRIAGSLGIHDAVVALTKADLADADQLATRHDDIRAVLSAMPFRSAPIIPCSARSGAGVNTLHHALAALLAADPVMPAPLHPFLPIDRVFSMPGRGTIVTGTLLGAALTQGDEVVLQPSGVSAMIRGLQSRGRDRDRVQAGERVAVNLRGVAPGTASRGAVLVSGQSVAASLCMDVELALLREVTGDVRHMEQVRVSIGTAHAVAQLRLFGGGSITPGENGFAQLRFRDPQVAFAGQRAILRRPSPARTIGGIAILDPRAQPARAGDGARLAILRAAVKDDPAAIARALSDASGGVARLDDVARLARLTQQEAREALGEGFVEIEEGVVCAEGTIALCERAYLSALRSGHDSQPLRLWVDRGEIRLRDVSPDLRAHVERILLARGDMRGQGNSVALATHDPVSRMTPAEKGRKEEIEGALRLAALDPLAIAEVLKNQTDEALFALSLADGNLVETPNVTLNQMLVFHIDVLIAAADALAEAFPVPQRFTTSEARRALGTSRRVIVPVLEYFDAQGVTAREADTRVIRDANALSPGASPC